MSGDTTTFPYGYRFTFTFPSEVTINTKSLKAKIPYEFKIKKHENSNNLTLEQAWTDNNVFTKKAGLDCTNSGTNGCTVPAGSQKLNIKVGNQKKTDISSVTTGKIKMETDQQGYNQGLKFTIADGDAGITDGSGDAITKLEELETYEITEDGGKYYLTKKTSPDELIKSSLGIKDVCELPTTDTPVECNLDEAKFKAINFEGKDTNKPSGTATLTISKGNSTDFPFGYRFTFKTTADAEIKANSTTIKAKIPTDFKIKKNTSSGTGSSVTLTLEKAWTDTKFAEKVGLTCTTGSECCTMDSAGGSPSVKLNVKKGTDKKEDITGINASGGSGKIKVEKDKEGYNQGLKFTISEGDVSLTGGATKSGADFTTLEEFETYEITEEGGKYYLTRKDEASKTIESQLGLKEAGCSLSTASCTLSTEKIKKIQFDDKDTAGASMTSGNATLTITKADKKEDFPLGYKFTLQSQQEITIKTDTNKVKANIPTDFKIKKGTSGASLTLEKAWDMTSLGKKIGLTCNNSSSNECSIDNSGNKLNVKQEEKTDTGLSKGSDSNSNGKIKVEKDQVGYNQGFKFTISDGNISLTGSTKSDDDKIKHLEEYETYEIKEEGDKWYLARKDKAQVFIKKALNIGEFCTGDFPKIGETGPDTCNSITDLEKLKTINFEGKDSHTNWGSGKISVQLSIERDTTSGGLKFTFIDDESSSDGSTLCLPTGKSNGSVNLKDSSNSAGVEYRIKKCEKSGTVTLTLEKKDGSSSGCSK